MRAEKNGRANAAGCFENSPYQERERQRVFLRLTDEGAHDPSQKYASWRETFRSWPSYWATSVKNLEGSHEPSQHLAGAKPVCRIRARRDCDDRQRNGRRLHLGIGRPAE